MTTKFKISACLLLLASAFNAYSLYATGVSFHKDDEERQIFCKCQDGLFSNRKCLASNSGDLCAQSEPGKNINCRDYSSNCN